jgi:hypothetical protein
MRFKYTLPTAAAALTLLFSSPVFAAPVVVRCAPGQHTIVRDGFARGHQVTSVSCVGAGAYRENLNRTRYSRYRVERRHRSWGKSALIIGGGAGTGAGIGGIVNGRKGALIGAGIGGGAASIYEGTRRR